VPTNLAIAAFVFGAVLVLIGLIGGGFKVFGAEVAEKAAGPSTRWASGVLGGLLLAFALTSQFPWSDEKSSGTPGPEAGGGTQSGPTPTAPPDTSGAVGKAAVPAPKVECASRSGSVLPGDVVEPGKFIGFRPPVGIVRVRFKYDNTAHPNPVYLRVTVFNRNTRIGEGFARTTRSDGEADVQVETQLLDRMESDWAEAVLCTEGRIIRVEQFPLKAPWIPLSKSVK